MKQTSVKFRQTKQTLVKFQKEKSICICRGIYRFILKEYESGQVKESLVLNLMTLRFTLIESLGFPEGTIQISGSTMVQAALGKPFKNKTDVDLYVSEKAAPIVRTWLTSNDGANLLFGGIKARSFYDGQRDLRRFMKSDNNEISHVEEYCKMPKNADKPKFLRRTKDKNLEPDGGK